MYYNNIHSSLIRPTLRGTAGHAHTCISQCFHDLLYLEVLYLCFTLLSEEGAACFSTDSTASCGGGTELDHATIKPSGMEVTNTSINSSHFLLLGGRDLRIGRGLHEQYSGDGTYPPPGCHPDVLAVPCRQPQCVPCTSLCRSCLEKYCEMIRKALVPGSCSTKKYIHLWWPTTTGLVLMDRTTYWTDNRPQFSRGVSINSNSITLWGEKEHMACMHITDI